MLKINIVSVIFSLIITVFTVGMWHNLDVAVFSIVIIYAFRCGLSEYYITKLLKLNFRKNMIEDLLMCTIFIVSGWAFDNFLCMVVYGVAYAVFVLIHRCNLQQILRALKE